MQPVLPAIEIPPGGSQEWVFAFRGDTSKQQPILISIEQSMASQNLNNLGWNPNKDYISQELTEKITEVTLEQFSWDSGEWSFEMSYLNNGSPQTAIASFDISDADVQKMKNSIPHYSSGLGIFQIWQFGSPDNSTIMQTISIK